MAVGPEQHVRPPSDLLPPLLTMPSLLQRKQDHAAQNSPPSRLMVAVSAANDRGQTKNTSGDGSLTRRHRT